MDVFEAELSPADGPTQEHSHMILNGEPTVVASCLEKCRTAFAFRLRYRLWKLATCYLYSLTWLPTLAVLVAVLSMFVFLAKGSTQFGNIKFDFEGKSGERLKKEIEEKIAKGSSPQNALMQEYHEHGLSQSRISFWFSLVFVSI